MLVPMLILVGVFVVAEAVMISLAWVIYKKL